MSTPSQSVLLARQILHRNPHPAEEAGDQAAVVPAPVPVQDVPVPARVAGDKHTTLFLKVNHEYLY